jgi:hypothetical protein
MNFFKLSNGTVATNLSAKDIKSVRPEAKQITGKQYYDNKTSEQSSADYDPEAAAVEEFLANN